MSASQRPNTSRCRQRGLTLLEVLVAVAIVAIAVFPLLQVVQESEESAFDAKFAALAAHQCRTLISEIALRHGPGASEIGDLSQFDVDEGFDSRFVYEDIIYEWEVQALDLSADVMPTSMQEEDQYRQDDSEDVIRDEDEDAEIDDRFRARYVRISVRYTRSNGEEREYVVETYLPPLRKEEGRNSRSDNVPPNRG